jgi:hypothetical protein
MSKLHRDPSGLDEADTRKGELRKPDDRDDQPGQGADLTPPLRDTALDAGQELPASTTRR